jgi:hypothetical protein
MEQEIEWKLVYTKARCEVWSEANLRNQGFTILCPRMADPHGGFAPLFPRYLFVGHAPGRDLTSIRSTRGVLRIVQFGDAPARVPREVIEDLRRRMDGRGVVALEASPTEPLYDRRAQQRIRALVKLAEAGFRVVAA